MNEWEVQVMYLLIMSTGLTLFFVIAECLVQAYWRVSAWWRNRR